MLASSTSPPDHAGDMQSLLAALHASTGFLKGAVGDPLPGWHVPGADNRAAMESFHARLRERYPQAGGAFLAVRVWTNLLWQPAYVAFHGVHMVGALPDLSGMSQQFAGWDVDGFRLPVAPVLRASTELMIASAGRQLRRHADGVLEEINRFTKLKPVPAKRLLVDRMLGLLVRLAQQRPDLPVDKVKDHCASWLAAMELTGHGDLQTIRLRDGREAVISARKGCCLDYMIEPGSYCANCPKQDGAIRRQRQQEAAEEGYA